MFERVEKSLDSNDDYPKLRQTFSRFLIKFHRYFLKKQKKSVDQIGSRPITHIVERIRKF